MSCYNLYGGTPKKTLDLMKYFKERAFIYVYQDSFQELKPQFEATGGSVYEGFYGRNLFLHLKKLLRIIDNEKIDIVQTQFSMGETLGYLIKIFRPKVKLIVAFVASLKPSKFKSPIVNLFYPKVDAFIYVSNHVKTEKLKQFPVLQKKKSKIIYNGTEVRLDNGSKTPKFRGQSVLCVGSLIKLKNVQVLIQAMDILNNSKLLTGINLYIAGEGSYRSKLEQTVRKSSSKVSIHLLGNQSNIGGLLNECDVFVHPSYEEGFGIAVAEAMHAEKPIIVSNAGALPELIDNEISGLIVDPHNAEEWANAMVKILENPTIAKSYAKKAKEKAERDFSVEKYTTSYERFYQNLFQI